MAAAGNVAGSTANATLSTAQLASHTHSTAGQKNAAGSQAFLTKFGGSSVATSSTGSGQGHSHNLSATFSGSASSVVQPFLTLIYIIKT